MNIETNELYTLRELREFKGYSQGEMAKNLKISQGHYNDIEKCRRKPNIDVLHDMAIYYGTSMDYMYHCFYIQANVFNYPDKSLAYGREMAIKKDSDYKKKRAAQAAE